MDYYKVLQVPPGADQRALRQAYRVQAKRVHPDAHPGLSPAAAEAQRRRFIVLAQAYETLSDPARRAAHDRKLGAQAGSGRPPPDAASAAQARPRPGSSGPRPGPAAHAADPSGSSTGSTGGTGGGSTDESGMDDLLRDVEQLLGRFGLDLRAPFEGLLDALTDWARALFQQVAQAWDEAGQDEAAGNDDGPPQADHTGPSTGQSRAAGGARRGTTARAAGQSGAAGSESAQLEAELAALRDRVRARARSTAAGAGQAAGSGKPGARASTRAQSPRRRPDASQDVEAELRRLKERLSQGA